MADVAALTGDTPYVGAIDKIWDNVAGKKLYITGGIGATGRGDHIDVRGAVADGDGERGVRQVAVAVLDGVGEDVVDATGRAGVAEVAVVAVSAERQIAIGAVDDRADRCGAVEIGIGVAGRTILPSFTRVQSEQIETNVANVRRSLDICFIKRYTVCRFGKSGVPRSIASITAASRVAPGTFLASLEQEICYDTASRLLPADSFSSRAFDRNSGTDYLATNRHDSRFQRRRHQWRAISFGRRDIAFQSQPRQHHRD